MKIKGAIQIAGAAFVIFITCAAHAAEPSRITVEAGQPGIAVPTTLHGLFFEDINYGADGGLYAELIQNRSFEDREPLFGWRERANGGASGKLSVENEAPLNANNLHFLRIFANNPGTNGFGAVNSGFGGIVVHAGDRYYFSVYARRRAGDADSLRVALEDSDGHAIASADIAGLDESWKKHEATLTSSMSVTNARLVVLAAKKGVVDVDMVSLFPEKTFKGRRNGLRADLAQALADMKPGFLRFPGGCIVEGKDFGNMYRWKDTIGDVAGRKQNWNVWQNDQSPEYNQTYGLGFYEYFQLCEDIGAQPVPVINCGMCCQARQGIPVPLDQLGPYIQDALDLIEFANGPTTSQWGARRAAMGHPKPFHMKFLAVGNEQWQQDYFDRYPLFYNAIKAKYPDIQLISSAGPFVNDPLWTFAWNKFHTGTPADVVDEHYYVPPRWLLEHVDRYKTYDRSGPKIFVGEYASRDGGHHNNLDGALAEASYMTGLLRNCDEVLMASYAPLFSKFGHSQWQPDLIWFDNSRVLLTPNYYVQALFSQNRPDRSLPTKVEAPFDQPKAKGMIGVGTWKTRAEFKDITVTAPNGKVLFQSDFSNGLNGWKTAGGNWRAVDGVLRQNGDQENVRAVAGDPSWADCTLTLKARKISGSEGFLIMFQTAGLDSPTWWNLGGWNNTESAFQGDGFSEVHVKQSIETNRWYDIRIESLGGNVKAYLDNKLVQPAERGPASMLYSAAGRDQKTGELVLFVVNPFGEARPTDVKLNGVSKILGPVKTTVLTSAQPGDENSLADPTKVMPKQSETTFSGTDFQYQFPGNSLTIFRAKTR